MYLDHLAVSGQTLEEACDYVQTRLGVTMQGGGEHAVFHTHNRLLGLGDGLYLEAIAINPAAPVPTRPRWFDLDRFTGPARLSNWICRSDNLAADMAHLPKGIGEVIDLQRGDLRWQMVVPESGVLPFGNLCPALIKWQTQAHPAQMLAASGCRLERLIVTHPEALALRDSVGKVLSDLRVIFEVGAISMTAEFETPNGRRAL